MPIDYRSDLLAQGHMIETERRYYVGPPGARVEVTPAVTIAVLVLLVVAIAVVIVAVQLFRNRRRTR